MEFDGHKLKTKLFSIGCGEHIANRRIYPNLKMHEMFEEIGIEISTASKFDRLLKQLVKVLENSRRLLSLSREMYEMYACTIFLKVSESNFHGYASVLFIIELACFHTTVHSILDQLYESIGENATLRHVTKIVMTYSYVNMSFHKTQSGANHLNFKYGDSQVRALFPKLKPESFATFAEMPGSVMIKGIADSEFPQHQFFEILGQVIPTKIPTMENLIVMEFVQLGNVKQNTIAEVFFQRVLESAGLRSVQELARSSIESCEDNEIYTDVGNFVTTCRGGCYLFNINPALAIVLNHINFTELKIRKSSVNDLKSLKKLFTAKKIPHLVIEDGSAEDVKRTMAKVQNTKFVGLKYLFVIVNSHGLAGDVICSKTGTYNLNEDIVTPLLANPSLQNVDKFVMVNACRGKNDHRDLDSDEELEYDPTDSTELEEKLVKMFSAVKGWKSYRDEKGSFFIQKFCEVFQEVYKERPMNEVAAEIERRLHDYWDEFRGPASEYCAKPSTVHNIKMEFKSLAEYKELLMEMDNFAAEFGNAQAFDRNIQIEEII